MAKSTKKKEKENYFKGVKKEIALVKWPTAKDVTKNTIATVILCVIVCVFFLILSFILAEIKGWLV